MRRLGRSMMAFVLVLTALVMPGAAWAQQEVSDGCNALNDPSLDGRLRPADGVFNRTFAAGDQITITAGEPSAGPQPPVIELRFNNQVVDQDGFPGTLEYTVPVDGVATVVWSRFPLGLVTWTVSCDPAPPPPPTCNGLEATVYVKDGKIVGGANDGAAYTGTLSGSTGNDVMVGTDARDKIEGREGNDTICGLGGNDTIAGASGSDTMLGGSGADKMNGGSGTDSTPDFNASEGDKQTNVP